MSSRPAGSRRRSLRFPWAGLFPAVCVLGLVTGVLTARAGNPLVLFDTSTQTPYAYPGTVNVYTDLGPNGILTNERSDTLVIQAVAQWTNVPTSRFAGTVAGEITLNGIPTDITDANVDSVISTDTEVYNGGGVFVIYDSDGSITSNFFGAPPGVAGISSPEIGEDLTPDLVESWTVLNGSVIDPSDTSPPGAAFAGVYTHEFGHAINLAHTQCNGNIIFSLDNDGPSGCSSMGAIPDVSQTETMYPYLDVTPGSTGEQQATVDLLDDIATLSDIYPAGGWPDNTGTIAGTVFLPDSVTQVTGVNVIARNVADPMGDCVSAITGNYTAGELGPDGRYKLTGLTPGAQYAVYIDVLGPGGFRTPPATVGFPEEYWNGASESGSLETDNACDYVAITAAAGVTTTADIYLNSAAGALVLADDDAKSIPLPFTFPFCGTNYNSVWVGSNGYVTFGIGDTNPNPSATALLVGAPRIAGLWADLDPSSGGAVVPVESNGDFEIKFLSVPEILFGGLNTFTITLRPNGSHHVKYGSLETYFGALAGRSPGGGAADPGATDLSAAAQPLGTPPGNETVYQVFGVFELPDLSGVDLEYSPCGSVTGAPEPGITPRAFALMNAYPNPFRASTAVTFDLAAEGPASLTVFDIRGRLVRTLTRGTRPAGRYTETWNGADDGGRQAGPGIYFYRLETPGFTATRKTIRIR